MEADGFNWGLCYEAPFKPHLNLQLMSNTVLSLSSHGRSAITRSYLPPDHRRHDLLDHKNAIPGPTGASFHHQTREDNFLYSMTPLRKHRHMGHMVSAWANLREERFLNTLPANSTNYVEHARNVVHDTMAPSMLKWEDFSKDRSAWSRVDEPQSSNVVQESYEIKPAATSFGGGDDPKTALKTSKRERKALSAPNSVYPCVKRGKRATTTTTKVDMVINGMDFDITDIPIPVCTCTGMPQQCYKWGCGGWQSACCTTSMSIHPLPVSAKRRGTRISGRKMSQGAFKKVLEKLSDAGYCFSNPIDLRTHWAKHGTNKFVTSR